MRVWKALMVSVALAGTGVGRVEAQVAVDSALAVYRPVSGISGNVSSVGSDTLNNLMTLWA